MYYSDKKFFKVLNAACTKNGFDYLPGLNILKDFIGINDEYMNCYFTDIEHIFAYLNYGPCFAEVTIPEYVPIIFEDGEKMSIDSEEIPGWYSNILILGEIKTWNPETVDYLIKNGADISVENYNIVRWSIMYNYEVFHYIQDYIKSMDSNLWNSIISDLQMRGFI